ncbi:hypothetical protein Btru_037382 [Bulinus truncatus]|nr:hypothetical protein Btru_037382 [Bulinus truncatus]
MTEFVPCLLRVGDNVKKYKLFKLLGDQVTIGRASEVTYVILSDMISRYHAVLKRQSDDSWTIMDNKSLNGIFVNGKSLSPYVPHQLKDGDIVQLGVPPKSQSVPEFVYKFHSKLKVCANSYKKIKLDETVSIKHSDFSEADDEHSLKRKFAANRLCKDSQIRQEDIGKEKIDDYRVKIEEMERLLKEKEENEKKVQEELEKERKEKEHQANTVREMKLKEQAILQELEDKQKQLDMEKESLKKKMQEELEANLKEREAALLLRLSTQREALMSEKKQLEEELSKEKAKVLEEKNKELEQQLLNQKEKLEKIIEKKEMEQKMLENQLNCTKEESESAKLQALKAREDVLSNFVNLMEVELQCSICNELFIKATSLNCSHIYCKLCINQWMKVRKECPVCREKITSQMQNLSLDSYIDKMVEQLSEELKTRRKELIEQRKVDQDKFDNIKAGPSKKACNRTQSGRTTRASSRAQTSSAAAHSPDATGGDVINVSSDAEVLSDDTQRALRFFFEEAGESFSDNSEDDSDNNDSSESVEGDSDAYYGGYGYCFKCGSRGHWARGCPF